MVNFDILWTVFAPDTLVVASPFMDSKQILRIIGSPYLSKSSQGIFRIRAWQWDWDGKAMLKVGYDLEIEYFRGSQKIAALPVYPLQALPKVQRDKLCGNIRKRAIQFIKATIRCEPGANQAFRYNGQVYMHGRDISRNTDAVKGQVGESRCINHR